MNKKSLRCKLGFHDWEELKGMDEIDIAEMLGVEIGSPSHLEMYFEEKVCLRCGKYVDEIMTDGVKYTRWMADKYKRDEDRRALAKQLAAKAKKEK